MARKEDIETAPRLSGAALTLKGVGGALATVVKAHADIAAAAPAEAHETDRAMRTVALIARAALALQQLQAAEDKADDRAMERAANRVVAALRARIPINNEGDETDMNERDPRLDTPDGVAEIYAQARQCMAHVAQRLDLKSADRSGRGGRLGEGIVGLSEKLAGECAPEPAPA